MHNAVKLILAEAADSVALKNKGENCSGTTII